MWVVRCRPPSLQAVPFRRTLSSLRSRSNHLGPRNSIIRPGRSKPSTKRSNASDPISPLDAAIAGSQDAQDASNTNYDPSHNTLLSPVHLPEDPNGVLKENHPAMNILANSGLVIQRQLEMMNIMM